MRASRHEAEVPSMIKQGIVAYLAPLHEEIKGYIDTLRVYGERLDTLTAPVKEHEKEEGVLLI